MSGSSKLSTLLSSTNDKGFFVPGTNLSSFLFLAFLKEMPFLSLDHFSPPSPLLRVNSGFRSLVRHLQQVLRLRAQVWAYLSEISKLSPKRICNSPSNVTPRMSLSYQMYSFLLYIFWKCCK